MWPALRTYSFSCPRAGLQLLEARQRDVEGVDFEDLQPGGPAVPLQPDADILLSPQCRLHSVRERTSARVPGAI